jgi:hypothetical protein
MSSAAVTPLRIDHMNQGQNSFVLCLLSDQAQKLEVDIPRERSASITTRKEVSSTFSETMQAIVMDKLRSVLVLRSYYWSCGCDDSVDKVD